MFNHPSHRTNDCVCIFGHLECCVFFHANMQNFLINFLNVHQDQEDKKIKLRKPKPDKETD